MARLLSGIVLRDKIKEQLKNALSTLPEEKIPKLAIIQVGSIEASSVYIRGKIRFGEDIGVKVVLHKLEDSVSEKELIDLVLNLNADTEIGGIIVQLPLPVGINKDRIIESIDPNKDVDGLHSVNLKKLFLKDPSGIMPATTRGILSLLDFNGVEIQSKRVLVIGRSDLVGKPTAIALLNRDATVTIAHHLSLNIQELCRESDIIVSATGVHDLITKDFVHSGQVIIDVGITRFENKIVGDVVFSEVSEIVDSISPVPGGVGPLTIASLFVNLLRGIIK